MSDDVKGRVIQASTRPEDVPAETPEDAIDAAIAQANEAEKPLSAVAQLARDPSKTIVLTVPRDFLPEDAQAVMEITLALLQGSFEIRQREAHHGLELPGPKKLVAAVGQKLRGN